MHCIHCASKATVKIGFQAGKQRHRCKDCRKSFTENATKAYPEEIRNQALRLYLEGLGFRSIGRFLGVSNVTVLNWIRQMGKQVSKPKTPANVVILELDELWHFVKKRQKNSGCGLSITLG